MQNPTNKNKTNQIQQIEEGTQLNLDFSKLAKNGNGEMVLPVVVQHYQTKEVIILAYLNQ